MPGMRCRCGEAIPYGEIPCKDEWLFISDVEFDKFSGSVDAEEIYKTMSSFLKCPRCQRLWVFWNGFNHDPTEYTEAANTT